MVPIKSAIHLLLSALALEFSGMSTSALAVAVGLVPVLARLFPAYKRGGWSAVKREFWKDAPWGVLASLGVWVALFFWFFAAAVYQDHTVLASEGAKLRSQNEASKRAADAAFDTTKTSLNSIISQLKTECAVSAGVGRTLDKQNRDQQMLIAGCQNQAINLLKPEPFKETILVLDNPPQKEPAMKGVRWLILTNKTVTPLRMVARCNLSVASMNASIVGSGMMAGGVDRLSSTLFRINISAPAWSPVSPLLVTAVLFDQSTICSFNAEQ